ncbi:MAG TPA: hypothetical protein VFG69_17920 [Nannocystaceae bacterium]|nr:hypothetical protein [Nannocystaceae bacterium]
MENFPIQVILFPLVAIAAVVFFFLRQKRAVAGYDQQFSNYRAGELAQRLGLGLVEGDPGFNLFIRHANVDVARGPSDKKPIHIGVKLAGQRDGRDLMLRYLYRVEQETGFSSVTWRIWFDCRMSAAVSRPFPPFEVLSRKTPLGAIARTQSLPEIPSGVAAVDAEYAICCSDPRMAALLAQMLPGFAHFASAGVHLVGDGQQVAFVMQQDKAPLLASALYYAEDMARLLVELSRRIGG